MKRFTSIVAVILTLHSFGVAQEVPRILTLRDAVSIALRQNFAVKQAQNNLERDETGVLAAYGAFLPSASAGASWGGNTGESYLANGEKLPSSTSRSVSSSVSARITLFDGFANTSSLSSARSTVLASEMNLSRTRQSVANQTYQLYYNVLRTEKLHDVAASSVEYNRQQLNRIRELARLGSASLVNVYQQEAQVGQEELRLVQAENDYEIARANLFAYLGVEYSADIDISDPTIPEDVEIETIKRYVDSVGTFSSLVAAAFDQRPDYRSSRYGVEAAESNVSAARAGYWPTISASADYSLSGGWSNRSLLGGTATAADEFADFGNNRSMRWGFTLSFPIFSGWQTDYRTQSALVSKKNAEEGLRDSERKIRVEVRQALLELEAARKNYEAAVKSLEYQDKNLKVNQEKYNVGSGTLLDLMFAENNYKTALTSKINAIYQYLTARSKLELAIGNVELSN